MPPAKRNQNRAFSLLSSQPYEPRTRTQLAIANCKILTLNDDCLLEVFSYLPTIDLCAVKDSCRRFNALANSEVQTRWKDKAFNCGYADGRNEQQNTIILKHFGHFIKNVMIMKQESIWPLKKYGAKKSWVQLKYYPGLKKLTIFTANLNRLPICQVKRALQSVESLDLLGCRGADSEFARIINACKGLKSLRISFGPSILLLEAISHETSNLEYVNFRPSNTISPSSNERPANVNEVTFNRSLAKLGVLPRLKNINIVCGGFSVTTSIASLAKKKSLERVYLNDALWDENLVAAYKNWAKVTTTDCWKDTDFSPPIAGKTSHYLFRRYLSKTPSIDFH